MWVIALVLALAVVAAVAFLSRRPARTRGDADPGRRSAGPEA